MRIRDLLGIEEVALSVFVPGGDAIDRELAHVLVVDRLDAQVSVPADAVVLVTTAADAAAFEAVRPVGLIVVRPEGQALDPALMRAAAAAGSVLGAVPDEAAIRLAASTAERAIDESARRRAAAAVDLLGSLSAARRDGGPAAALRAALEPTRGSGWIIDRAGRLVASVGGRPEHQLVGEVWNGDGSPATDAVGVPWSIRDLDGARVAAVGCAPEVLDALAEVLRADLRIAAAREDDASALVGALAAGARDGDLSEAEIGVRLRIAGRTPHDTTTVLVATIDDPAFPMPALAAAAVELTAATGSVLVGFLGSACVVLADRAEAQPLPTWRPAPEVLSRWLPLLAGRRLRIGVADPVDHPGALGAAIVAASARPPAESARDTVVVAPTAGLVAHDSLLALLPAGVRARFAASLIGPLDEYDARTGSELVRTLRAFLDNNGAWVDTARMLDLHPNTMRYRMSRVEEVTGRDLSRMADRVDLFLALACRDGG